MLKSRWQVFQSLLFSAEIGLSAAIFAVLVFSVHDRPPITGADGRALLILGILACSAWPVALSALGLYSSQRQKSLFSLLPRMAAAGVACTVFAAAASLALSAPVAPVFPFLFGASQFAVLSLLRLAIHGGLRLLRLRGRNTRNVLIAGSGPRARAVQLAIEGNPSWGLRIVGFVDEHEFVWGGDDYPRPFYKIADLAGLFRDKVIDEVIVALPRSMFGSLGPVAELCALVGVPLTILSDFLADHFPSARASRFGSLPTLSFAAVHHSAFKLGVKRFIDIVGASAALVAAAPLIAAAAVAIRATSRGPAFFRQVRCGLYGRKFSMLKLRTMVIDAEEQKEALAHLNESDGPVFKIRDDPRVTPVGRFLRRWSIDETPQFWNVLKGDMSLVGPRPPVPSEVSLYEPSERRRLSMRPGITCLWQVNGRTQIGFDDWVKLDHQYIDDWSLSKDVEILLRTLPAVVGRTGAS